MRCGWFTDQNGDRIDQEMTFPGDHPVFPGQPKGLRCVLQERGLYVHGLKPSCARVRDHVEDGSCCLTRLLSIQPDFQAQKSSLEETIEEAGHLCIFLPKFHCELNPIEFFWGLAKRYTRGIKTYLLNNLDIGSQLIIYIIAKCTYNFTKLKDLVPEAFESIDVLTIRRWEHRMWRWIDAYKDGLNVTQANFAVKQYKSHRRIPQRVADTA